MRFYKKYIKALISLCFLVSMSACGDNDSNSNKLTKGHRDAIKSQCEHA